MAKNMEVICRVCLKKCENRHISLHTSIRKDEDEQPVSYAVAYTSCTQLEVQVGLDGLPEWLCNTCGRHLQCAYDFRRKARDGFEKLYYQLEMQKKLFLKIAVTPSEFALPDNNASTTHVHTDAELMDAYSMKVTNYAKDPIEDFECENEVKPNLDTLNKGLQLNALCSFPKLMYNSDYDNPPKQLTTKNNDRLDDLDLSENNSTELNNEFIVDENSSNYKINIHDHSLDGTNSGLLQWQVGKRSTENGEASTSSSVETLTNLNSDLWAGEAEIVRSCKQTSILDGKFFEVILESSSGNALSAKCKTCGITCKGKLGSSSNFLRHLKRNHETLIPEYEAYKLAKRKRVSETPITGRVTCKFSQQVFEQNVANFILENQLSFQLVEDKTFRKIFDDFEINHGNQPLKHLTKEKIGKIVNDFCANQLEAVKNELSSVKYVCLATNIWRSVKHKFFSITANWIDEGTLERKSAALACRRYPGTVPFDRIGEYIVEICDSFGLSREKIVGTVTQNGFNEFIKAFRKFGITDPKNILEGYRNDNCDESGDDSPDDFNEISDNYYVRLNNDEREKIFFRHLGCASHTLSLVAATDAVNAILEEASLKNIHHSVIKKCEILWKAINSPRTREALMNYLGCSLNRPIMTRWNSLFEALTQIYSLKDKILNYEICSVVEDMQTFEPMDFEYIAEYLEWYTPLARAIDILQGEDCHYGYLLPTLLILRKKWQLLLRGQTISANIRILLENVLKALTERFHNFFNISDNRGEFAAIAAFSHPKFKTSWLSALSPEGRDKVKNLTKEVSRVFASNQTRIERATRQQEDFFDFDDEAVNNILDEDFPMLLEEESKFREFFNQSSTSLNLLNNFPTVKDVFLKYNTALPSSTPVERLLSFATFLDSVKYNHIKDSDFEKRVLYKANSKFFENSFIKK